MTIIVFLFVVLWGLGAGWHRMVTYAGFASCVVMGAAIAATVLLLGMSLATLVLVQAGVWLW